MTHQKQHIKSFVINFMWLSVEKAMSGGGCFPEDRKDRSLTVDLPPTPAPPALNLKKKEKSSTHC